MVVVWGLGRLIELGSGIHLSNMWICIGMNVEMVALAF